MYSVIYLTVESSCRNCFYYHPKAGDDIVVLLGKFCLWRLFGVFYAGRNESTLPELLDDGVGFKIFICLVWMTTLFEYEINPFALSCERGGLLIMHYFVMTELESLGTFLVLIVVDVESKIICEMRQTCLSVTNVLFWFLFFYRCAWDLRILFITYASVWNLLV